MPNALLEKVLLDCERVFSSCTKSIPHPPLSLIVLFSDFTDPTAAELMVESIGRLVSKHLVLFVTIADHDLEDFIAREPDDMATLAQSVTADTLLHQRQIVLQRLRRMGVDVIEAPYEQIGFDLIDKYFMIKNSEAIG